MECCLTKLVGRMGRLGKSESNGVKGSRSDHTRRNEGRRRVTRVGAARRRWVFSIILLDATVMHSMVFNIRKAHPSLQSELLKTIAGCEEDKVGGVKSRTARAQFSMVVI
ncbi:hypothetical protein K2173_015688 [Erythroxylum novogranatense]|uniref:Uncharacterized protein n=1 Tax=Erythroxylum novogranatense TaxID=1862640 RepID=A0AAV8SER4_9ROSI|nr:hypothetical protein K2173_015688 [Erythroxylum novogranatense]